MLVFFFLRIRRPPRSTRTDTLFPYTTLFRSVPVTIKGRKGDTVVADDEYIRTGATLDAMTGLRPAFKKDGTVTAANASGINDGGAAIILMSAKDAEPRNAPVLGRIASWAPCAVDPVLMRSEQRRGGKEGVGTCGSRGPPSH